MDLGTNEQGYKAFNSFNTTVSIAIADEEGPYYVGRLRRASDVAKLYIYARLRLTDYCVNWAYC
jgi:hypothetical protein